MKFGLTSVVLSGKASMTEQHELRIPHDDLKYISLECQCGAKITIDLSREECLKKNWLAGPLNCVVCTMPFDSQVKAGLMNYIEWYKQIGTSGQKVFFRVKK